MACPAWHVPDVVLAVVWRVGRLAHILFGRWVGELPDPPDPAIVWAMGWRVVRPTGAVAVAVAVLAAVLAAWLAGWLA